MPASSRGTPRHSVPGRAWRALLSSVPTAAILSVALMLDHLGLEDAARSVEAAVIADLADRKPGETRTTAAVGDAIAARVAG